MTASTEHGMWTMMPLLQTWMRTGELDKGAVHFTGLELQAHCTRPAAVQRSQQVECSP